MLENKYSRRELLAKGGVVGAGALFAGSGIASGRQMRTAAFLASTKRGGTVTWALSQDPGEIAPFGGVLTATWQATQPMYESLLMWDKNLNVKPALATGYTYRNAKTIDFHLRKGVSFHDGQEMTAADCVYSFGLQLNPPKPGSVSVLGQVPAIAGTEAKGKYTLRMHLSEPDARIMGYLAWQRYSAIVPENMYHKVNAATEGIGTGPYKLNGPYVPNQHINYRKFPDYWNTAQPPRFNNLNFRIITDDQTLVDAIRTGAIDGGPISVTDAKSLASNSKLAVQKGLTTAFREIQFTIKSGSPQPWDDVRVRQAVNFALNRHAMIENVFEGSGAYCGFIPPGYGTWPLSAAELKNKYEKYDLAKAKALMSAAGYANGFSVTMSTFSTPADFPALASLIKYQLSQINIDVTIAAQDPTTFATNNGAGSFDWDLTWRGMRGDPDGYLAEYSPAGHSAFNIWFTGYKNAKMAALVQKGRTTAGVPQRHAIYTELQKLLENQLLEVPLIAVDQFQAQSKKIKNMYVSITGGNEPLFRQAYLA